MGAIFIVRVFKIWLQINWLFNYIYRKELKDCFTFFDKISDQLNNEWEKREIIRKQTPDLLNERPTGINLLDVVFDNQPMKTEDHDWRDELTTMTGTGSETVVGAISFLLITLGHYPEVQDKIFEEIQEVMGDLERDVTPADVTAMTYLNQVIMESIRMHGNVIMIMRKVTKDTKLSSCTLPAGSRLILHLWGMGWNEEQFPHPNRFLPERFSPEQQQTRHKYSFMPFSAGPRNCIGKAYAMMMMKTVLVHVLRRLTVTSHTKLSDIVYEFKLVMFSKTPLLVTFHPR
uniref:Cytochrome P450 n=1 Tax=Graphocephala atropunctata TaxID=36148 RepID=A0A1B6MQX0_9HEMI